MSHVLFFVTEPGLPKEALALGFAAHLAYPTAEPEDAAESNFVTKIVDMTNLFGKI